MDTHAKPIVVISKCLGFDACRYNGEIIQDNIVHMLRPFVQIITVCPEVEIGLGTPRHPIRMVANGAEIQLIQPATEKDITADMNDFADKFLGSLEEVDGFILKNRSPSCAISDAKIFSGAEKSPALRKSSGLFGGKVKQQFAHVAIEDEGRLKNRSIREHFFIKLFTLAHFRQVKKMFSMQALVEFQSQHKYLFMAYHQLKQKELGRIVANAQQKDVAEVLATYEKALCSLLSKPATYKSNINVLYHIMGYFSEQMTAAEKEYFISLTEKYRAEKVPLSSPLAVLKAWAVRFDQQYLLQQTYFEPYPEPLVQLADQL